MPPGCCREAGWLWWGAFLTVALYRTWYRAFRAEPRRLLVDNFILMDPLRTLRLRAPPFWLIFNVEPSARTLGRLLESEPPFDEIDVMLFSHGTEGIGVAPIGEWRRLAARAHRQGRLLGVDERRYLRDFATFVWFHRDLCRLGPVHALPPPLAVKRFDSLLREFGPGCGIEVEIAVAGSGIVMAGAGLGRTGNALPQT